MQMTARVKASAALATRVSISPPHAALMRASLMTLGMFKSTGTAVFFLVAMTIRAEAAPLAALKPATSAPERALATLDMLGLTVDGDHFVRAAESKHPALVQLFLSAGLPINAQDASGRTALLAAAQAENWPIVEKLLAAGANPNTADEAGRTPLMAAAVHGHTGMVRELLRLGAEANSADQHGHSALAYAIAAKRFGVFEQLHGATAKAGEACCERRDLLAHAMDTGDWRFVEPLLMAHEPNLRWSSAARALLAEALNQRDQPRIRLLLSKHVSPPAPEGRAQPLLAWALARNNLELFQLLLDCGADPNTPLNTPGEKEFLELIPTITVRHYIGDEPGMNVLMMAAGLGRAEFVKLLLEKGANRTAATASKHRLIPLYFASWAKSPESIQLLLQNAPPPEKVRVEISLASQSATLLKDGVPVIRTDISSGRAGYSTPAGTFVVTDKKRSHISSIYKVKMPFFMRLNCRDFGLHEGHIPGYPASHGCIRLPSDAARRLFNEVPIGTLVTIR